MKLTDNAAIKEALKILKLSDCGFEFEFKLCGLEIKKNRKAV